MKFPRSVEAARGVGLEKKVLAEALYAEVPPRGRGRRPKGEATDPEMFEQVAEEIFEATGERYAADTLRFYRDVAAWAAGNSIGSDRIRWADASWTAHREAYGKGESFAAFTRDPTTKRGVRERNGGATGDVPAAARAINQNPAEAEKFVAGLSDEAVEAIGDAVMNKTLSTMGVTPQPRGTVPDPEPRWRRLCRRIALDVHTVRQEIADLHDRGRHAEADRATQHLRDTLAEATSRTTPVPDTIEGLT